MTIGAEPSLVRRKPVNRDWIGSIPQDWDSALVKLVARLESGHTPSRSVPEYWQDCTIPWFSLADVWQLRKKGRKYVYDTSELVSELGVANSSARVLPTGTVMLSRTASVGFTGIMGRDMATTQDFVNWVCGDKLLPEYLWYCLQAMKPEYERLQFGSTHQTIYMPDVAQFKIPVPSRGEQERIANFLDEQTARIDALIAEKSRLHDALHEQIQALTYALVTRGLTNVRMKPTHVLWLGEVPEHWSVARIKHVARLESGHTPDKKVDAYWQDCDIPWVSLNDTRSLLELDYITETTSYINQLGIDNSSARLLPAGTVFFSRDATIGRCGIAAIPMACSQHFIGWVCGTRLLPEYLLFVLRSMTAELERVTMGATLKTIGMDDVKGLSIPLPPLAEQRAIVGETKGRRQQLEDLARHTAALVDRLREYRSSLISAAVTGQLDIDALQAKLPKAA